MTPCPSCGNSCDETHKFCPTCGFPISQVEKNTSDPFIGKILPGGYVVLELIGVGGMGRVYRGEQSALGRTVAVKVIHQSLLHDESAALRFITEARAASRLNHPNSVSVIDFGKTDDGQLYLVMEFLRGRDLAHVLHEEGPLPFRRIVLLLRQVLAALAEAHDQGIVHRDLKPENIIMERVRGGSDFVKVVDFGLAKLMENDASKGTAVTRPGIVCGTPDYMAPEQGRGDPIDHRTDIYAVGVILFLLLTGRLPFEADSPTQVVLMHLTVPVPDPKEVAPERGIPQVLVDVCKKALSKDARDRFKDSDGFAAALNEALTEIEASVRPVSNGIQCGACGSQNPPVQKFCGECGVRLVITARRSTRPPPDSENARISTTSTLPLPLIHRENDLAWLDDRRTEVQGAMVGARLVGEDGFGKTRLVSEFLEIARAAGDKIVEVGPDPWWADVGYFALRNAVIGLGELAPDGGTEREWTGASFEARRGLSEIFGRVDRRMTLSGIAPDERRYLVAEALRWALVRAGKIAGKHRVLLVVDDLQRVDGASRNAIADAFGEPPPAPVLLLVTHTPGFESGLGAGAAARLLGGLPTVVLQDMLRAGPTSLSPRSSPITQRGVAPCYLDQLIRFIKEGGSEPPPRLVDMIALRIERLPATARRILQAVAIVGDGTPESALDELLPDLSQAPSAIDELERAGMIFRKGDTLSTSHPLLREVATSTIPAGVRRDLHAAALALADAQMQPIEARALHAYHAQDSFEALLLLEQAATRAAARGDTTGSINNLRRGLDLARREFFRGELDDPARAVLIFSRKLGEALAHVGNWQDADGVLREALDLAGPTGTERAKVLGALATVARGRARAVEAEGYLRAALDIARRAGDDELVRSLEDQREIATAEVS